MQVTFGSGRHKFVAVDDVNFEIYKGETFALVGESGSGKTTIGRAILRIIVFIRAVAPAQSALRNSWLKES